MQPVPLVGVPLNRLPRILEHNSGVMRHRSQNGFRASFDQRWRKAINKAREITQLPLDFTFHDIKAKGISDFEGTAGEKQFASGHKTERQVHTYDRKVRVVPTLESKK